MKTQRRTHRQEARRRRGHGRLRPRGKSRHHGFEEGQRDALADAEKLGTSVAAPDALRLPDKDVDAVAVTRAVSEASGETDAESVAYADCGVGWSIEADGDGVAPAHTISQRPDAGAGVGVPESSLRLTAPRSPLASYSTRRWTSPTVPANGQSGAVFG